MASGMTVFYSILSICLLIFVGFIARRMKLVPENSLSALSGFFLDVATPCYIATNMVRTVSRDTLGDSWRFVLLGFLLIALSDLIGLVSSRLWSPLAERPTFRYIIAVPNWLFLGMAVCEPLFGDAGARVVLLFNFSVTIYIWTLGMTGFRGGLGGNAVKELVLNTQIIATLAGLALALAFPFLGAVRTLPAAEAAGLPLYLGLTASVWNTVEILGGTALPLSIFSIGLRLAAPQGAVVREKRPGNRSLLVTSAIRLLVAPAICLAVLLACFRLGFTMSQAEFVSAALIMSMPTAVASLAVAEVYGGSTLLAARAILWMTVASLFTVPAMTRLALFVHSLA